jgi:hypothetical protein
MTSSARARRPLRALLAGGLLGATLLACQGEGEDHAGDGLPAGYPEGFVEVRGCRTSVEHGLVRIRILAPAAAAPAYDRGPYPLPRGTVIVKEEFEDPACASRTGFALMHKDGAAAARPGGWSWQRLDQRGAILESGALPACSSCHARFAARDFLGAE